MRRMVATAAMVLAVVSLSAALGRHSMEPVIEDPDRVDCPGHDFVGKNGDAKFAGPRSKIPEFHDCQRFIDGDTAYRGLYALFAAFPDKKDSRVAHDSATAMAASFSKTVAFAAGEVITRDGAYTQLGITRQYNCLYLTRDTVGPPRAFMLSVGANEDSCPWAIPVERVGEIQRPRPNDDQAVRRNRDGSQPERTELKVRRVSFESFTDAEYPAAARWQRGANGNYMMGMKCGAAWCVVGADSSVSHVFQVPGLDPTNRAAIVAASRRVVEGWFDEQELAEEIPGATGPGLHVRPSGRYARVTPVSDLGDLTLRAFNKWTPVGTIKISAPRTALLPGSRAAVDPYLDKLGLETGENRIELRLGGPRARKWQARIIRPSGKITEFGADPYHHPGFPIPGTLRWRWLADDETIWVRCDDGCCQVQQHDGP